MKLKDAVFLEQWKREVMNNNGIIKFLNDLSLETRAGIGENEISQRIDQAQKSLYYALGRVGEHEEKLKQRELWK